MIVSKCPKCGAPGRRTSWQADGDMTQHTFACSEVNCPRAVKPWYVLESHPQIAVNSCPVCGLPYLKRFPTECDHGLFIHQVRRDPSSPALLEVTDGCFVSLATVTKVEA